MIHRKLAKSVHSIITSLSLTGLLCMPSVNCLANEVTVEATAKGSKRQTAVKTKLLTPAYTKRLPEVVRKPPINIRAVNNVGYIVSFEPPLSTLRGQPYLLSIPGISLLNRLPQDVMSSLQGELGSTVHIQVVNYDGKKEDIELLIPAEEKANGLFSTEEFFQSIDRFNTEEIHSNLLEKTLTNNDLLVKGYCSDSAKKCSDSEDNGRDTLTTIFQCLAVSQAIGDLDGADKYLQLALSALNDTSRAKIRTLNFPLFGTIKNLVALGKTKEALEICRRLASPIYQQAPEHIDPFKILECLPTINTGEALMAQFELIDKLYPVYSVEHPPNTQNLLWFGQLLERIDKTPERSLKLYSIEERLLREREDPHPTFVSCQKLAFCLYVKAQAEARLGNTEQAAKDLAAITDYYKEKLTIEQYNLLDQLPLYFPTPLEVAAAQAALPRPQSIAPLHPIQCEPWYEGGSDYIFGDLHSPFPRQLILTNQCFTCIKNNDKSKAIDLAKQLLHGFLYQQADQDGNYSRIHQNLFCTTIRIARAFSDKGWVEDSDDLLREIANTVAAKDLDPGWKKMAHLMIAAEEVVNSLSNKQSADKNIENKLWEDFENNYLEIKTVGDSAETKRISFNFEKCKRLRLLAMNYSFADEYKRAKLFFDRVSQIEPDLITDEEALRYIDKQLDERFLLRINRAILFVREGDYGNADKCIKLAQEQQPEANQTVIRSLIRTADIFIEVGQTDHAIDLLKTILSCKLVDQYCSVAQLKTKLTALLFKKGNNVEGLKLVEQTTAPGNAALSTSIYMHAADLEEKSGNYAEAAKYYSLAASTLNQSDSPVLALSLLRRAIACAERDKAFNKDELATYYLALAGKSDSLSTASIKLREKALTLMSNTNPKKPEEISTTAYLRRESSRESLTSERQKKQVSYAYKTGDTLKERIAMEPRPTAEDLESALKAATLAAKNKLPDAGDYWMRLANSEALAKKFDLACTHARLSIAAYNKTDPRATTQVQIIGQNGVAIHLAAAGAPELGRVLFREAIARVQEVQGQSSLAAQMQLAQYFDYCIGEKDTVNSMKVLDELLATNLNLGTYFAPNPGQSICTFGIIPQIRSSFEAISIINTTISNCFKRKEFTLGQLAVAKLVAAERMQFPPDDYRTALTLEIQASGYADSGDNLKAEALYREARPALLKHGGWGNDTDANYRKVLQAVNKQDELDKMDADAFSSKAEKIKQEEARNR